MVEQEKGALTKALAATFLRPPKPRVAGSNPASPVFFFLIAFCILYFFGAIA